MKGSRQEPADVDPVLPIVPSRLSGFCQDGLVDRLVRESAAAMTEKRHGDYPRWKGILERLPETERCWEIDRGCFVAGEAVDDRAGLEVLLKELIPWRKGPLRLAGVNIRTEWRSDFKWDRIAAHVDFTASTVLDVGAGNGYFGWRMLEAGADQVIGCDPTLVFVMQHCACLHFAGPAPNHLLPLGLEALPTGLDNFDIVSSLGVLYHRKDPMAHLGDLYRRLKPGGTLILETLIVRDAPGGVLVPEGRYARMRNVHALPTIDHLVGWLKASGYRSIRVVDQTPTTPEEQDTTEWMPFHSLPRALDPDDSSRTIENHPAPLRAVIIAHRD